MPDTTRCKCRKYGKAEKKSLLSRKSTRSSPPSLAELYLPGSFSPPPKTLMGKPILADVARLCPTWAGPSSHHPGDAGIAPSLANSSHPKTSSWKRGRTNEADEVEQFIDANLLPTAGQLRSLRLRNNFRGPLSSKASRAEAACSRRQQSDRSVTKGPCPPHVFPSSPSTFHKNVLLRNSHAPTFYNGGDGISLTNRSIEACQISHLDQRTAPARRWTTQTTKGEHPV